MCTFKSILLVLKLTELPRHLFQCEELRQLNVADNGLEKIPAFIGKLKQLQLLNLSRNCKFVFLCKNNIMFMKEIFQV